jgi:hypothetical protein
MRRGADLKDVRNDLVGLMGSNKPWEVLVGQAIASVADGKGQIGTDSLSAYLGTAVCNVILKQAGAAITNGAGEK